VLPDEIEALAKIRARRAHVDGALEQHSEAAVIAAYKTFSACPRISKPEALDQARECRRALKQQIRAIRAETAPFLARILRRALDGAEGVEGLVQDVETDRAEAYSVPFQPSQTLLEIRNAVARVEQMLSAVEADPEFADVEGMLKAIGQADVA